MASLVKNGNTYGLIWTDSSRSPKQVGESLKTDNQKRAKRKKAELENAYYEGTHDPWIKKWYQKEREEAHKLLSDAVEQFIVYKSRAKGQQGWSDSVAKREAYVLRKFVRHVGKDSLLKHLSSEDLENFYYRDGVTSDHTRNGNYISINTFLNWSADNGFIDEKPEYKPKKPQRNVPKFLYPKELAAVIKAKEKQITEADHPMQSVPSYWIPLGWLVLAGTGMRPVELAHIKRAHVNEGFIIIGEDFTTKVRAQRHVPLLFESKRAVDILLSDRFRRHYVPNKDLPYLLGVKPSYAKKKLSSAFTKFWDQTFPDKPKRRLYNLKDMFCVRFLSDDSVGTHSGMKLNELKEILGHSSISTTEKYLKAIPYGTSISGSVREFLPSDSILN